MGKLKGKPCPICGEESCVYLDGLIDLSQQERIIQIRCSNCTKVRLEKRIGKEVMKDETR